MKLFLAGVAPWKEQGLYDEAVMAYKPFILESFFYAKENSEATIQQYADYLLDSGAFTFMTNSGTVVNWDEYVENFAHFVKRNNVDKFFELDIDSVVGYKKVLELRQRLETLTGRQPIPVWHKSRGREEYLRHCAEYKYVALGGIVSKEITDNDYKFFPWFISEAHKQGAKIHALGFTNLVGLTKYHFDSVDSTAWTTGNRFGYLYKFDGKSMGKIKVPPGKRFADPKQVALNNYVEWCKFQRYASTNL